MATEPKETKVAVPTPHGPQPQTREPERPVVSEATEAEQKAGMEAIQRSQDRLKNEQEMGKRLIERAALAAPRG